MGLHGIAGLARVMAQTYRRKIDIMNGKDRKRKAEEGSTEMLPGSVKRKKKKVLGVLKDRFFPTKSQASEAALAEALEPLEAADAGSREEVFEQHRDALQARFNQSADILTCVPGFFDSLLHAQKHFEYLGRTCVLENIQSDFSEQFENIRSVVKVWCRTEDAKQRLAAAEVRCVDLKGSKVPLYVALLRELNCFWHEDLGGFIRFAEEPEPNSPHLLCRELPGTMEFDFHMEQKKVCMFLTFP